MSSNGMSEGWESRKCSDTGNPNKHPKKSQWEMAGCPAFQHVSRPTKVKCSHILVKHAESQRPTSWREKNITKSKDEAMEIAKEFRRQILNKEKTFAELAREHSDCLSAIQGGDVGFFKKRELLKPFEEASFALKIGQLSQPVESRSGIHIILRTA